jgi:uncharacterized protein YecE (DUF72 family)
MTLFDLLDNTRKRFDRDGLQQRLAALARREVRIGGSSWKYEGWIGQIYTRDLYLTRGKLSRKLFEETCLAEYARVFPTVCGDFAFYQFPSRDYWAKLFRHTGGCQTGPSFLWGFKAPEHVTVSTWPSHPRYGATAGLENHTFLDSALFNQAFLGALEPYRAQVGVVVFEFGTFRQSDFADVAAFVRALDPFLGSLAPGWRFGVEIRNADYLVPRYFDCLRAHNIAHVYNAWTRMPEIGEQMAMAGSRTSDLIVSRALLRRGRPYEEAVRMFEPYSEVRDVNEPTRRALRELVDIALVDGTPAFLFVNNRLEGNSPGTMVAITDYSDHGG